MSDQKESGSVSAILQSLLCSFIIIPLAQAGAWALACAIVGEYTTIMMTGVGGVSFLSVYAFGPSRWLSDPDIGGKFGHDHPILARFILLCGVAFMLGALMILLIIER